MKQDICSVTIDDKRVFSYFSVALGLMADLDLGTEHLRWMGDVRFVVGYLQGGPSIQDFVECALADDYVQS